MRSNLHIDTFALGEWMTNCYVLWVEGPGEGGPCWIVDAGFEPARMIAAIRRRGLRPEKVILTHAHVDHIAGLHAVKAAFPEAPILVHQEEEAFLAEPTLNLSFALDEAIVAPAADQTLHHGQFLSLAGLPFEVRHTPGHSPGGITLYQPEAGVALVGDALFQGSIGRTDFPTSDPDRLLQAIAAQLLSLPDDTQVFPGHGPATTIGRERAANPYLRGLSP